MTQDNNPETDIKVHHQAVRPSLVWELLTEWHWALCVFFFFFFLPVSITEKLTGKRVIVASTVTTKDHFYSLICGVLGNSLHMY